MFSKFLLGFVNLFIALISFTVMGQNTEKYEILDGKFTNYEILEINAQNVYGQIKNLRSDGLVELKLSDEMTWRLSLENSGIIANTYQEVIANENGTVKTRGTKALPMQGRIIGQPNSRVSLTFNDDFIYGFVKSGFSTYYIEPLRHYEKGAQNNKFVLYSTQDIIPDDTKICGYELYEKEMIKTKSTDVRNMGQRMNGGCIRVYYAIASDWSMVDHYGTQGTINHNIGVLNNVQTNYDDEFADEINFFLNDQWLSNCSSCDPWPATTNSGTVLNSFTSWAVSGFSNIHNVGSMWSRRDYDNNVIGLAWLGVICTANRYNILQDFSNNANLKRVLMAHEIGHNFDATHNSGIMAPSVNTSTQWTATSISEIEAHYNQASCLDDCPGSNPIGVNFDHDQIEYCGEGVVFYSGISPSATSWEWTFEGGTPATSNLQYPEVTYDIAGSYEVTLEVSNGSNSATITKFIDVDIIDFPVADFQAIVNGLQVNFLFTGVAGDTYEWNFGDGNTSSSRDHIHSYSRNGIYNVSLTVTNICGEDIFTFPVEIITLPFVNFNSNIQSGCQPLTVGFSSLASNIDSIRWSFPGGIPATSTEADPTVLYSQAGIFEVSLEAFNSAGSSVILRDSFIQVSPLSVAGFDWVLNHNILDITNTASGFDSIYYSFGYGSNSSEENPRHYYYENGTFIVTQHLVNGCGLVTLSDTIVIALPPEVFWIELNNGVVCFNDSISFYPVISLSPDSLMWVFDGGIPHTSTDEFPTVVYPHSGHFNVTLMAWNAYGSDTLSLDSFIVINGVPNVGFSYFADTLSVAFNSNISDGNNLLWNFGDGNTSTEENPTHVYQNFGQYTVTLSASNDCGDSLHQQNIIITSAPSANFSSNVNQICFGESVQFINNSSASASSFLWTFEGGSPATSTERNPSVTYNASGSYDVTLVVSNNNGSDDLVIENYITVDPSVSSTFGYSQDSLTFTGNFTGSAGSNLLWTFGDGTSSTVSNPTKIYADYGTYTVQLIAQNACGIDTSAKQVFMYVTPSAGFVASSLFKCVGDSIQFQNNSEGPYTELLWRFEGGEPATSNEENPLIFYNTKGVFNVQLVASNPLSSDTLTLESLIEIESTPVAKFDILLNNLDLTLTYTGGNASVYSWDFGDGSSSSEQNPQHTYGLPGEYFIKLEVTNSCGKDSLTERVVIFPVSTNDFSSKLDFVIWPNPTHGILNIKINDYNYSSLNLSLQNSLGQILEVFEFSELKDNILSKDISHLHKGIYFVTLKSQGSTITKPLIIID